MIKTLTYEVTFPSTGRTFKADLAFQGGMTAITGPNEEGKSLVIELFRFLLFGTEALRGVSDDYKTLKVNGTFSVRDQDYRVERTISGAKLFKDKEQLATGVRPVNAHILKILGFGLDVFDVACAANQGDVEKLAQMKPTERKRMVDKVIGVDRIDELMKWCGEEALGLGREITVMDRALAEPVEPMQPQGYRKAEEVAGEITVLRAAQNQLHDRQGWLRAAPSEPAAPVPVNFTTTPDVLQEGLTLLSKRTYDFDPEALAMEWSRFNHWEERVAFEQRHPRPTITTQEALAIQRRDEIKKEITRLLQSPTLTCPCGKDFTIEDNRISALEVELATMSVIEGAFDVHQELMRNSDWARQDTIDRWEKVKDAKEAPRPSRPQQNVEGMMHADDRTAELKRLGLSGLTALALQQMLRELATFEARSAIYDEQIAAYRAWQGKAVQVRAEIDSLTVQIEPLANLEALLRAVQLYDQTYARYVQDKAAYEVTLKAITEKKDERANWLKAKDALATLRDTIKTYLVPSLSKVASHLINEMTGGERTSVVVDQDFDVVVDGQPLATLSGSGKACANLALRIGLGQVLTNNVFSIFIGDEIDASMDQNRADNLQMSLENILGKVSQILLVTHKIPIAQQVIAFGDHDGRRSNQS